ncbi:cutinase transcription factor 1 alpha [Penicillium lagena]|uniref:cutinase transcription factor 1 alpha n=1 Tax=Penicillium lagena TaxID=94218 RepID=UPI00253FE4E0|nr:cutinase transcription factor 1 alpha [Penicillium lagena]KAJ5609951.1 cutinase transcription factor 1 alpha [Penicillium lagena]
MLGIEGSDLSAPPSRKRQRSSIACQACHNRRVKCNAAQKGLPCTNCEKASKDCRLIVSKRNQKRQSLPSPSPLEAPNDGGNSDSRDSVSNYPVVEELVTGSQDAEKSQPSTEGIETLYARMLEDSAPAGSHRNLVRPRGHVMYLGETFNLTYLLQQIKPECRASLRKLHFPLPLDLKRRPIGPPKDDDGAIIYALRSQGAFVLPSTTVCRQLFRDYFHYVHPHYPILDRADFAWRFADPMNPSSYLLLQSVLLMAVGHCDRDTLQEAGFQSRYEARLTLYRRAKALYDADHELDKVTIVQSIFLISFWWNSPTDQKDTWHWLGIAISLAITLGMHRSTKHSDMSIRDQRLWKRIWWSLFTEDKHAAAALGRPVHIHLKDCDVEPLEESDFEEESDCPDSEICGSPRPIEISYMLHLTKLSKIGEQIIQTPFHASSRTDTEAVGTFQACDGLLQDWEITLPEELQLARRDGCLWPNMLYIAYNWFKVLMYRTRTAENSSSKDAQMSSHHLAMRAADQIIRLTEEVLSSGQIHHCPVHIVPGLFAAMGMHAVDISSGDTVREQLGYVKIELSMIALRELQDTWPVSGWIFLLFSKILRRIRERENKLDHNTSRPGPQANPKRSDSNLHTRTPRVNNIFSSGGEMLQTAACSTTLSEPNANGLSSRVSSWDTETMSIPVNYPTDWDELIGDEMWTEHDFDIMFESVPANRTSL